MILYIAGIGTVYFVGNVTVVATAKEEHQGTVSGIYNMFLNVGGAVLGVAVLTVISDSVASNNGGKSNPQANLEGYRAGYYAAIAMIAIKFILSIFFAHKKGQEQEQQPQQQGEQQEREERKSDDDKNKAEKGNFLLPQLKLQARLLAKRAKARQRDEKGWLAPRTSLTRWSNETVDLILTWTSTTICRVYIDRLDWIEADNTHLP